MKNIQLNLDFTALSHVVNGAWLLWSQKTKSGKPRTLPRGRRGSGESFVIMQGNYKDTDMLSKIRERWYKKRKKTQYGHVWEIPSKSSSWTKKYILEIPLNKMTNILSLTATKQISMHCVSICKRSESPYQLFAHVSQCQFGWKSISFFSSSSLPIFVPISHFKLPKLSILYYVSDFWWLCCNLGYSCLFNFHTCPIALSVNSKLATVGDNISGSSLGKCDIIYLSVGLITSP